MLWIKIHFISPPWRSHAVDTVTLLVHHGDYMLWKVSAEFQRCNSCSLEVPQCQPKFGARPSAKIQTYPLFHPPPPPPQCQILYTTYTPTVPKKTCTVIAKTQTCLPTLTKICVVISQSTIPPTLQKPL